jgi:hypothetical protein
VFSQRLDRAKPLWELWLVDRVGEDRFAIISKTHHCLVDGISGVDIATVLFDLEARSAAGAAARAVGAPVPSRRPRCCGARPVAELAAVPLELARATSRRARPSRGARRTSGAAALRGLGALALAASTPRRARR